MTRGPELPNPRTGRDSEPLLRLLAWNMLAGGAVAIVLSGAVIAFDVGNLRSLIVTAEERLVPILLLVFGFLVTFCSVAMGTAVMGLGADPSGRSGGGGGHPDFRLVPLSSRRQSGGGR
ncbi:hypothetical protein [Prosthecomicrobium sp. N25]|uniref:hypothetical protein n=1 Tax=Prosthecomicrobium sp. N25 TaxID=3129254 RepID=UPI0030774196